MIKKKILDNFKNLSLFVWVIGLILITFITFKVYKDNNSSKHENFFEIFNNIYLLKTLKEITSNLESRYSIVKHTAKDGDTYQSIINKLDLNKKEKSWKNLKTFETGISINKIDYDMYFGDNIKNYPINFRKQFSQDKPWYENVYSLKFNSVNILKNNWSVGYRSSFYLINSNKNENFI